MTTSTKHHQFIVIGAGVAGIYQIKRLVDMGLDAIVLEGDEDLGGTWYRNRYPGARFDSESYTYGYSFSQEVLDEWHWKERFSPQSENLKYLNFVVDKFNLRQHMRFNKRVTQMTWDEDARHWQLDIEDGDRYTAQFVLTAIGILSSPTTPRFKGMDDFQGEAYHTYWWPKEPVSFEGKRVGIIGTGATGIQVIAEIADKVGELTVFQRRPNWSKPLNNSPISEEEMADIRSRYDEIFARCAESPGGFEHTPDRRGFWNVSKEERIATYDRLYDTPGFALLNGNFREIILEEDANKEVSEYVANRIRQRVKDPKVAEKLIPKDHGFGVQRLPLETNYFEAYNRDNVHLVDVTETPIERVTETGIQTSDAHYDLDLIIYATGFDAITGAFDRLRINGKNNVVLGDKWRDGPVTYLGVLTRDFPNLFMLAGPQSASGSSNFPRSIERGVDWVTNLVEHIVENKIDRVETTSAAEEDWQETVKKSYSVLLLRHSQGWFTGYNSNIAGREIGKIRYQAYFGTAPKYGSLINQVAEDGYSTLQFG